MKIVKQPEDSYLCQACCMAMIVGVSLDVVLEKAKLHTAPDGNGKKYLTNRESIRFLLDYWMTLGASFNFNYESLEIEKGELTAKGIDLVPALLCVKSKRIDGAEHAVVWDPEIRMVLDPREDEPKPLSNYQIIEWTPVVRIDQDVLEVD